MYTFTCCYQICLFLSHFLLMVFYSYSLSEQVLSMLVILC